MKAAQPLANRVATASSGSSNTEPCACVPGKIPGEHNQWYFIVEESYNIQAYTCHLPN